MKKFFGVIVLMLAMAISAPAFALGDIEIDNHPSASATGISGGVRIEPEIDTHIDNRNIQGQIQGQKQQQGQIQGQQQGQINVNDQVIAPEQKVIFKSPTQLLAPPSQGLSELNFGNGRMKDVTKGPYKFALFGIQEYNGEPIREVLYTDANVKMKNYFQAVLDAGKKVSSKADFKSKETRIIVIEAEAQKSWTSGGNLGGAGSAVPTSGLVGGSMAGSIIPQWGGTKADDLRNIFIVKVLISTPIVLYEKKPEVKVAPRAETKVAPAPASTESKGWFKF